MIPIDLVSSADVANADVPVTFIDGTEAVWAEARCLGPARTAVGTAGDNLVLYRALEVCQPGDVIVADLGGRSEFGHWGDLLSQAAVARGVAGLVIAGGIRDRSQIAELGFPVFHMGHGPRKTTKVTPGKIGSVLNGLSDRPIRTGDLVVADADGVVIVPAEVGRERLAREVRSVRDVELKMSAGIADGLPLASALCLPEGAAEWLSPRTAPTPPSRRQGSPS